jgi:hypothetical protein
MTADQPPPTDPVPPEPAQQIPAATPGSSEACPGR